MGCKKQSDSREIEKEKRENKGEHFFITSSFNLGIKLTTQVNRYYSSWLLIN